MSETKNNNSNIDKDFNLACKLCEKIFEHNQLIEMLKTGTVAEKQYAALSLDHINNKNDAFYLISNLTGCDGKIREAVAHKINQLLNASKENQELFASISAETFADATIDINGNICRLITDSALLLKSYNNFSKDYTNKIILFAKEALRELDKFIFRDKKYTINKQIFKLYWCLETLKNFYEFVPDDDLKYILEKSALQKEYTIREKVAEIIANLECYNKLKNKLKQDENYYVRRILT